MTDPYRIGTGHDPTIDSFREAMVRARALRGGLNVLELGTRRWEEQRPTHHRDEWGEPEDEWVLADYEHGTDVDAVADVHTLGSDLHDALGRTVWFDAVIACSVLEHVMRPWQAFAEIGSVLRQGGIVYVATHQTFPIHGYPSDYWRFTIEALDVLGDEGGIERVDAHYQYPCRIKPPADVGRWNELAPAYLGVSWYGRVA